MLLYPECEGNGGSVGHGDRDIVLIIVDACWSVLRSGALSICDYAAM